MKKIYIMIALLFGVMFNARAQTNPCGCTPTSSILTHHVDLGDDNHISVEFTMVQCSPNVGIIFNKATFYSTSPNGIFNYPITPPSTTLA
jgi:hypothetical protein